MIKKIRLTIALSGLLIMACSEEKYIYDDPTDIAMFSLASETFIATDAVDDNIKELYIASPVRKEVDRTYLVQVLTKGSREEAKEDEQYELASSAVVSIPAGELTGSFKVRVFPQALSDLEDKVAYFSLTAVDNTHPVADFNNNMTLVMGRTCAFAPEDIAGRFDIATGLMDVGTYGNIISNVTVEVDPEVENGFIMKSPYTEGVDLKMKLWPLENGTWEVELPDSYLAYMEPETPEQGDAFKAYAYGRGIWYPCRKMMYVSYYIHLEGSSTIIGMVTDQFVKK